jgi:hypothetical protein
MANNTAQRITWLTVASVAAIALLWVDHIV